MRIKTILMLITLCCLTVSPALAGDDAPSFVDTLKEFAGTGLGAFGCFFCPIYSVIFDALNNLATNIAEGTADLFLMIAGIGLLFLIAWKVGRLVTQLQEVDIMQFLEDLFKPLGRAIIAVCLLMFPISIFYYLVSPMVQLSLTAANVIYTEAGAKEMTIVKLAREAEGINLTVNCTSPQKLNAQNEGKREMAFSPSVKESLICNLQQVSASLVVPMVLGSILFIASWFTGIFGVIPNFVVMGIASILIFFYFFMLVSYSTKLLDALMRLAFVAALMPIWIVLWIFPGTAQYTKKAWDQLLTACFMFLALNVMLAFILLMLDSVQFPDRFIDYLVQGKVMKAIVELTVSAFVACLLPLICMPLLGAAEQLAGSITGAQSLGLNEAADKVADPVVQKAVGGVTVAAGADAGAAKAVKAGMANRKAGGTFRAGFGASVRESMTKSKLAAWTGDTLEERERSRKKERQKKTTSTAGGGAPTPSTSGESKGDVS